MKQAMKKTLIYQQIRKEIVSGKWQEGDKLPTEFEYAYLLGVSRETIRNAFHLLEKAGYIERVKAKGTFVHLPDTSKENRIISLLVPCDEYLRFSGVHFQQLLFDLIAEAAKVGWGIVPVIFSRTNSNQDIWWENLSHFNADSRIVVNRSWFSPYFETLASFGARVAHIDDDISPSNKWSQYTSKWLNFLEDNQILGQESVNYLLKQGCRRIGLILQGNEQSSIGHGYRKILQKAGLPEFCLDFQGSDSFDKIRSFQQKNHLDGAIIHIPEHDLPIRGAIRESFGFSANMPIVAIPLHSTTFYSDPKENIVMVHYDIRPMAHDIVKNLIVQQYLPKVFHYAPYLTLGGSRITKT